MLAEIVKRSPPIGHAEQNVAAASEPIHSGMSNAQHEADRDCGVYGVAAMFQDVYSSFSGSSFTADHHRVARTIRLRAPNKGFHHARQDYQSDELRRQEFTLVAP